MGHTTTDGDARGVVRVDLDEYHQTGPERERVASLMDMVPLGLRHVLDIGARDGYITRLLAERCETVSALDLKRPQIDHSRIICLQGDATALAFPDRSFDLVFCAEVLEHIPSPSLERACAELARVSARHVLVGVPYRQDTRVGRTTCGRCGGISPPWGHVNSFDEGRLRSLFAGLTVVRTDFVGVADAPTSALAAKLMDWAGNPYGPYSQEEHCLHCDAPLQLPVPRSLLQRGYTRAAVVLRDLQRRWYRPHANWIHILFELDPRR